MKSKFFMLTLAAGLAFGLASCGNKGNEGDHNHDTTKKDTTEASVKADAKSPAFVCAHGGAECGSSDEPGKECCGQPMVAAK